MADTRRPLNYLLRHYMDKYPAKLVAGFPHVTERIEELWDDRVAIMDYFNDLLIPQRPNRAGFPADVAAEIFALSSAYSAIRKRNAEVSSDPWSHERAKGELEALGWKQTMQDFSRAIETGNRDVCLLFVQSGFDLESRDVREWTPLMIAAFNGKEEIALMLVEQGANIHAEDRGGYSPMHWAAYNGYGQAIRLLLSEGGQANVTSKSGITPILQAAARGHVEACEELIQAGANVNTAAKDGTTPLIKAISNGHERIVKLLLEAGAHFDVTMKDGTTLVDIARKCKNWRIQEMILGQASTEPAKR